MKKRILVIFMAVALCFCGLFGCAKSTPVVSIVSIEKTASEGLVDTYTVTYSDGTTSTLEITNGEDGNDGADGESLTADDLYNKYKQTNPNATYEDFLRLFDINVEGNVKVINKALLSSAKVYCEFTETYRNSFMQTVTDTNVYLGSAVIYKTNADYTYFITNYHVVYNNSAKEVSKIAKKITCYLYGSEGSPSATDDKDASGYTTYAYGDYAISCEYVGGSVTADVAVIRARTSDVTAVNPQIKTINFASEYKVGETAIAIGNPEGEGISATEGVVSVDNEYIALSIDGTARSYRAIRIDTAIYNGSSGGGLFDGDGNLIGITNAGDGEDQNVNYAVPLQVVKNAVENIMYYHGKGESVAKKIKLGVTVTSKNAKFVYSEQDGYGKIVEEVTVSEIEENSIVSKMGVVVGDILVGFSINGVNYTINRNFDIGDALFTVREGDSIAFIKKSGTTTVTLAPYTVLNSDLTVIA